MHKSRTKMLVGLGLTVGLITGTATAASAAQFEVMGSGSEAGGVAVAASGRGASGETSGIGTDNDGGGGSFWQWGVGKDDTWSNYFREKRCHGATAVGKKSKRVTNVPGGRYAMAMTPKARSGNKAYYHNC